MLASMSNKVAEAERDYMNAIKENLMELDRTVKIPGDGGEGLSLDVIACSRKGNCDTATDRVTRKKYVQQQLKDVPTDWLKKVLDNMGISYNENDRGEIESLVVWDAACWLRTDLEGKL